MMPPDEQAPARRFGVLRTIALYKIVKVLLLLAVAYGELRLRDASLWRSFCPGLRRSPMAWSTASCPVCATVQRHERIARDCTAAGDVGLCGGVRSRGHWAVDGEALRAEWLTVFVTGSLIPLEVWEMIHRPTWGKLAILLGNVIIVAYLVWHVLTKNNPVRNTGPVVVAEKPLENPLI